MRLRESERERIGERVANCWWHPSVAANVAHGQLGKKNIRGKTKNINSSLIHKNESAGEQKIKINEGGARFCLFSESPKCCQGDSRAERGGKVVRGGTTACGGVCAHTLGVKACECGEGVCEREVCVCVLKINVAILFTFAQRLLTFCRLLAPNLPRPFAAVRDRSQVKSGPLNCG